MSKKRQEAESYLKKNNISLDDKNYLLLREISIKRPALLGILTKIHFGKKVPLSHIERILDKLTIYKNDIKRDKINVQSLFIKSFKYENPMELLDDVIVEIENKSDTLKFINDLQHSHVRNKLKKEYFEIVLNGIISLKSIKDWKKQLPFITKKSASFTDPESFLEVFENLIKNSMGGFTSDSISQKIEQTPGSILLYKQDGYVLAQIFDFPSSKKLGSSSWCISRSKSYYDSYASSRQQMFLWNTNEPPSSNDSMIGITTNQNGSVNTSHKKNDSHVEIKYYINQLIKNGKCDISLKDCLFSKLSDKSDKVQLYSSIYNGNPMSEKIVYTILKNEWNSKGKMDIEEFKSFYGMFCAIFDNNRITKNDLSPKRILSPKNKYKVIVDKVIELSLNLNLKDLINFYNQTEVNIGDIYPILINGLKKHREFNTMDNTTKFYYQMNYMGINTVSKGIGITNNNHGLLFSEIKVPIELTEDNDLVIGNNKYLISKIINNLSSAYNINIKNLPISFILENSKEYKNSLNNGNDLILNNLILNYSSSKYVHLFLSKLNESNIMCDKIIILNKNVKDTLFSNIITKDIEFKSCKKIGDLSNLMTNNNVDYLSFIDSKVSLSETGLYKSHLKKLSFDKCVITDPYVSNLTTNHLSIKCSTGYISNMNFKSLKKLSVSSNIIHNFTDDQRNQLNKIGCEIIINGGVNYKNPDKILHAISNKSNSRESMYKIFDLLNKNDIDINSINKSDYKYLPSVTLMEYVQSFKNRKKNYIIISLNDRNEITYFCRYGYEEYKNKNRKNRYNTYGDRRLRYIDDNFFETLLSGKNVTGSSISNSINKDKRVPSFKKIKSSSDYCIIFDQNDLLLKKKSLISNKRSKLKVDIVGIKERLKLYKKSKYSFNEVIRIEDVQSLLKRILPRITCMTNIVDNSIIVFLNSIIKFYEKKYSTANVGKLNRVNLPISKSKKKSSYVDTINSNLNEMVIKYRMENITKEFNFPMGQSLVSPSTNRLEILSNKLDENKEGILSHYINKLNNNKISNLNDLKIFSYKVSEVNTFYKGMIPKILPEVLQKSFISSISTNYKYLKNKNERIVTATTMKRRTITHTRIYMNDITDIVIEELNNSEPLIKSYFKF